jgi:putative FmdB family regulatory protein
MPTYEYRCDACGHKFERFQSIKAEPVKDCSQCGEKNQVRRLISGGAGLIFKGSGFYSTDYRSDSYKQAAKQETAPSTTSPSTPSTPASATSSSSE